MKRKKPYIFAEYESLPANYRCTLHPESDLYIKERRWIEKVTGAVKSAHEYRCFCCHRITETDFKTRLPYKPEPLPPTELFPRWILYIVIALGIAAMLAIAAMSHAQPAQPTIAKIHSMEHCPPCDAIIAQIVKDGGVVGKPTDTGIQHATSYPTIIYSTGEWDNGKRVKRGTYTVDPNTTIPITKLVQK